MAEPEPAPPRTSSDRVRTYTAYPLFERSRPRNVCVRFGRATASTVMNRHDSFNSGMETTTLHATIEGRPTNRLRKSCGSAKPHRQEKLRARALHDENGRGGPMMPPGCCSRFVWPTRSTSLLARAPIVVCSRTTFYLLGIQAHFWSTRSVGSGPTRGEAPFDMVPVGKDI